MTNKMNPNTCPKCGATIPADAPQGLCPKCVMLGAVTANETGLPPTATAGIPSPQRVAAAFPQLEILELLGRGGMGFVFKARQPHLDRFVALKLLPEKLARDPHFAERFSREARVLARLNHPGIVSIFDFGQAGGFYFLVMEYVDGVNLQQAMQAGKFSPAAALAVVPRICEALQFAHEQGVLHRDIKPANILLDSKGRVKIADFGIAKLVGDEKPDSNLTATGAAIGTPQYMAPEQLEQPATVDHRADIYSLGVVFYEMLTGELPIGRFAPPSQRTPLDPRVDEVVMRTLEKEREKRFQSAGEVKTNVEHLTEPGVGASKGTCSSPAWGPDGTIVMPSQSAVTRPSSWSKRAVAGAALTGISLPMPLLFLAAIVLGGGGMGLVEIGILLVSAGLFGVAGTILGWMALSDIRASKGTKHGLPLAVFAALTWPLLLLLTVTVAAPTLVLMPPSGSQGLRPLWQFLIVPVPAGILTFCVWAVYATVRWGGNKPPSQRRGVLKWVFFGLIAFGLGALGLSARLTKAQPESGEKLFRESGDSPSVQADSTSTVPWIGFTFTAVELREVDGRRWLAIDYLDNVHGDCQKSFPWETKIPGFRAEVRASEFGKDPAIRHQRVEYLLPDSVSRDAVDQLRANVEKALKQKTIRVDFGQEKLLFEFGSSSDTALKAWIKVIPPPKL